MIRQIPSTLLVMLVGLHLGWSMGISQLVWLGVVASLLLGLFQTRLVAPTPVLAILVCIMSAIAGYQLFSDLSIGLAWIQNHPLFAGLCLGFYINLLWLLSARPRRAQRQAIDNVTQSLVVISFVLLFIVPQPAQFSWTFPDGTQASLMAPLGVLLGIVVLFGERLVSVQFLRLTLLLPSLLLWPGVSDLLITFKSPLSQLAEDLIPKGFQSKNQIGFSPFQSLTSELFKQGTAKVVMRVRYDSSQPFYLVGNRHTLFDSEKLQWHSGNAGEEILSPEASTGGKRIIFNINDHVSPPFGQAHTEVMQISSLVRDDGLFLPPGARGLEIPLPEIRIDERRVWQGTFNKGAERSWKVHFNGPSNPSPLDPRSKQLPQLWDSVLAKFAQQFAGPSRLDTVRQTLKHFSNQEYSLDTDIHREYPLHDFLINNKPAFCFWYATATALILRENGVPTRLVSGYFVDTQAATGIWLVHDRDAHAWVEWQDEGGYWHTLDPTPPSLQGYRDRFSTNYFSIVFHLLSDRIEELDHVLEQMRSGAKQWLVFVGMAILLFLFLREYGRIRQTSTPERRMNRQWSRIWRTFLSATKLPDEPSWSASDYVSNLPTTWEPDYCRAVINFISLYGNERFACSQGLPSSCLHSELRKLKKLGKLQKLSRGE